MQEHRGTYSPEDNKLRLYPAGRLDPEEYAKVKEHGFSWAPKQGIFVAPMWTPGRADFLAEFCESEIEDEDTTLVERAEIRAERFEDYSEKRAKDGDQAHKAIHSIMDGIPLGQPILVGHHSERHARKDAERIENGMRKAVKMWETSAYWEQRAAGALRHAKYKELPAVRYRRIKGLEADKRKREADKAEAEKFLRLWANDAAAMVRKDGTETAFLQRALAITNMEHISGSFPVDKYPRPEGASTYEGSMSLWSALGGSEGKGFLSPEQARDLATDCHSRTVKYSERWINHISNRIAYEKAMLEEGGGLKGSKFDYEIGGQVLRRYGEWFIITKINKKNGEVNSVSVMGHFASTIPLDEIKDYRPPNPGDTEKITARMALPPLCNYPGEGFLHMTKEEYTKSTERCFSDFPKIGVIKATDTTSRHRIKQTRTPGGASWDISQVFITDAKRTDPPLLALLPIIEPVQQIPKQAPTPREIPATTTNETEEKIRAIKESLKAGVQVVAAPQLFPTPAPLAARMVELAEIEPGHEVLEPSAGTGRILEAIQAGAPMASTFAVEVVPSLAQALANRFATPQDQAEGICSTVLEADFLKCNGNLGTFDRILMNPPFADGSDIEHIQHAFKMLKPGGILVAICANGPRQNDKLKPMADTWEVLPADTFKESGTGVNTALLTMRA